MSGRIAPALVSVCMVLCSTGWVDGAFTVRPISSLPCADPCRGACDDAPLQADRRAFMEGFLVATVPVVATACFPSLALASGGATAGGVYLLSAKQRYNERVRAGVKGFLAIGSAVESGDIDAIRSYFADDTVGTWKDLSTAGYLLANAFRRNSTAAPDSLPAVKKWKAFAGQVEALAKGLKSKNKASSQETYQKALAALDDYLAQVELPPANEL